MQLLDKPFHRFLLVGGLAAAVNFVARILLNSIMSFRWAVFVAYLIGMLTAYILTRSLVFEPSGRHPAHELFWFSMVNLAAVIQVWGISVGLAEYLFPAMQFELYPNELAHAIGLAVPAVTSYFGHKYLSFSKLKEK